MIDEYVEVECDGDKITLKRQLHQKQKSTKKSSKNTFYNFTLRNQQRKYEFVNG